MSEYIVVEGENIGYLGQMEYRPIIKLANYGRGAIFKVRWDGDKSWLFTNVKNRKTIDVGQFNISGNLDNTKEYIMKYTKRDVKIDDGGVRWGFPIFSCVHLTFTPVQTMKPRTTFMLSNQYLDYARLNDTLPEYFPSANPRDFDGQKFNEIVKTRDLHREIANYLPSYGISEIY